LTLLNKCSISFDRFIVSCIHRYRIIPNKFNTLKIPLCWDGDVAQYLRIYPERAHIWFPAVNNNSKNIFLVFHLISLPLLELLATTTVLPTITTVSFFRMSYNWNSTAYNCFFHYLHNLRSILVFPRIEYSFVLMVESIPFIDIPQIVHTFTYWRIS
jgi:hypothetical protein